MKVHHPGVVPSEKPNALARDLGVPVLGLTWTGIDPIFPACVHKTTDSPRIRYEILVVKGEGVFPAGCRAGVSHTGPNEDSDPMR